VPDTSKYPDKCVKDGRTILYLIFWKKEYPVCINTQIIVRFQHDVDERIHAFDGTFWKSSLCNDEILNLSGLSARVTTVEVKAKAFRVLQKHMHLYVLLIRK